MYRVNVNRPADLLLIEPGAFAVQLHELPDGWPRRPGGVVRAGGSARARSAVSSASILVAWAPPLAPLSPAARALAYLSRFGASSNARSLRQSRSSSRPSVRTAQK